MAQTEIKGLKELEKQLDKLALATRKKTLSQAAGFAMTPVVSAARRSAPKGSAPHTTHKGRIVAPGFLSRQIKKKARAWKNGQGATVSVGPTSEAFYGAQFVELGTENMAAQEWLEPAFKSNQAKVLERFKQRLREKIKAAAR